MKGDRVSVAVVGAGVGGLTAAVMLGRMGFDVTVYEQAKRFSRVGLGIQMQPNAMKVMRVLGIADDLQSVGVRMVSARNRAWDTGELLFEQPLGENVLGKFGEPWYTLHRGDLHAALQGLVPSDVIQLNKRLTGLDESSEKSVALRFEDGTAAYADIVVGADGIHSRVREHLLPTEDPHYSGLVAYRAVFARERLGDVELDPCCKWWGIDRHIVFYFVSGGRDVYFTTSNPHPEMEEESFSATGTSEELVGAFEGFHPTVIRALEACPPPIFKFAIYERQPLPTWSNDRIVLLGDACHPMTPFMAQGAGTAMEDAVVLARCLEEAGSDTGAISDAFRRYEASRKERTSRCQEISHSNTWLSKPANFDWIYGYDAGTAPLAVLASA